MSENSSRHERLRAVFDNALLQEPSAREGYLDQACEGDSALRRQVIRLLAAHQAANSFLERPPGSPLPAMRAEDEVVVRGSGLNVVGGDFPGTERFSIRRRLGVGGMGVVYEAHDRSRDEIIALKTLLRASPADIYRLKREFRSLADVAHVNLVSLYELIVEGGQCFFTMELVTGVNFVDYVRGMPLPPGSAARSPTLDRLIPAFRQLVDGVSELHRVGKIHRDIKPSNVLVTPEGRVVVLDFGLITDLVTQNVAGGESIDGGTPAYVSPEGESQGELTESSDWYSVGATLYEALTGSVPFDGPFFDVLQRKRASDPPAPAQIAPDVPDDLSAVCMGLLCRDPERRLSGREALVRLGLSAMPISEFDPGSARRRETRFIGRERQLEVLRDAFCTATPGRPAAVYVCGPSGIGKSALVRCFLDQLHAREDVVVLSGRCYEREFVPYNALDGVVDSLSRYLLSLPRSHAEPLMPRDVLALSRLFPVLRQVEAVVNAGRQPEQEILDPLVLRRRAFAALGDLLARIADRQPLVISIDDWHWADADSVVLLEELLRPPNALPALVVVCFRSEEVASKPFLQTLVERAGSDMWSALPLGPLMEHEAFELIRALMPAESSLSQDDRLMITREAGGNPFFVEQLAHYSAVNVIGPDQGVTFEEMLEERLRALPAETRPFLQTLATCGRPMAPELVYEASGLTGDRRPFVAILRSAHFIRSSGSSERIEMYHDRIREALAAQLSAEGVRRIHGLTVRTLVARRNEDPEVLFEHYRGAGDHEHASIQAEAAAEKANLALAFDRAAFFYRQALELAPHAEARLAWEVGLAGALANAGRPADAAEAYIEAARDASPPPRIELQRRGAEQFLIGGHIDRGLDVMRTVLGAVGMRLARGPRSAIASRLWRRAHLRWRGLDFVERSADQIAGNDLLRIDTCWSVMTGLAMVDMIRAFDFSARHLLLALDAGEPYRVVRALAVEAIFAAGPGGTSQRRTTELLHRSQVLSEILGHSHAIALSSATAGMAALAVGQWKKASGLCERALSMLRDRCVGMTWELNSAQNFLLGALLYQGELREVSRQLPTLMAGARDRGNLYIETELCTRMNLVWLAADRPDEGERQAVESLERWSHKGFHRQHYSGMLARAQTELYRGSAEAAWRLITENWPALRRSHLLHVQLIRIEAAYLRARCALAMAAGSQDARWFLSIARHGAGRITGEQMPWSDPLALLLNAAVAYLEGNTPLATGYLADAADRFDRADMHLYAAVAQRRLGELLGDAHGRELQRQADEWMVAQDIKNPAFMTRMLAPGFPDLP